MISTEIWIESMVFATTGMLAIGSITIVIVLLISKGGWKNGLGYVSGYITGYLIIGIGVLLLRQNIPFQHFTPNFTPLFFTFAVLLLFLSWKNYSRPVSNKEAKIFKIIDGINPIRAFELGLGVTVLNIKNLILYLAAISVVVFSDISLPEKLFLVVVVVFVFCSTVLIPILIFLLAPHQGEKILVNIRKLIDKHYRAISIWIPVIFATIFIVKGGIEIL